jgi:hypothetical protein
LKLEFNSSNGMSMEPVICIAEIIKDAGGATALGRAFHAAGVKLGRDAIYKWVSTGIPDRHWPTLIALSGHPAEVIYRANCHARGVDALPVVEAAE